MAPRILMRASSRRKITLRQLFLLISETRKLAISRLDLQHDRETWSFQLECISLAYRWRAVAIFENEVSVRDLGGSARQDIPALAKRSALTQKKLNLLGRSVARFWHRLIRWSCIPEFPALGSDSDIAALAWARFLPPGGQRQAAGVGGGGCRQFRPSGVLD